MNHEVRILGRGDASLLRAVADDVFDGPTRIEWSAEFLADPRHHLAVALADGLVVGMASAVHYIHPDKPNELWVNEVGVAPPWQRQGIGKMLLEALFQHARSLGIEKAWVATERDNSAARALYRAAGGIEDPDDIVVATFDLVGGPSSDND